MKINFPTVGEYNQLIQKKGGDAFSSLKGMILIPVRTTPIKVFLFGSGAYAAVFMGRLNGKIYAIRCFLTIEKSTIERNKIICDYLMNINSNWKTDCEFIDDEIMFNERSYPILKMEWIEGSLINDFVTKHLNNNNILSEIQKQLIDISNDLENHKIGHGDLQCGNIIVNGDSNNFQIRLIDYDGMYVPELVGKKSIETGRSEFQHPGRDENFYNEKVDRFSFWVILTALEALKTDKSLWLEVMQGGFNTLDNFLFTVQDFLNPNQSKLFSRLYKINSSSLNFYLDKLKWFCENEVFLITRPELEGASSIINNTTSPIIIPNLDLDLNKNGKSENSLNDNYKIVTINGSATVLTSSFEKIGNTPLELDKLTYQGKTIIISNGLEIKQVLLTDSKSIIEVELDSVISNAETKTKTSNTDEKPSVESKKKKATKVVSSFENQKANEEDIKKLREEQRGKEIQEEITRLNNEKKLREENEKKTQKEANDLEREKEIKDIIDRLEKERKLKEQLEKKALEEAEKLKQEQKKQKKQKSESNRTIFYAILIILFTVVLLYTLTPFDNLKTNKNQIKPINTSNIINTESHSEIIKGLLLAEESRDFDKIYSYYSSNMNRYWDFNYPSYNILKRRYEFIWGFTENSKNYVEKIEKISENTYDLHTKFEYFHLNRNRVISSNSVVRYVFGLDRKIVSTYGLEETEITESSMNNKIFYDENGKVCSENKAEFYRMINFDEDGKPKGIVRDYYITGELQWDGYLTYADEYNNQNDIMDGKCVWYYKNGAKLLERNYNNGELNGRSMEYYENGKKKLESNYSFGELVSMDNYTEEEPVITTTKVMAKLREAPLSVSNIILLIPEGETIEVLEFNNFYFKVKYLNKLGYLNQFYLVETIDLLALKNN